MKPLFTLSLLAAAALGLAGCATGGHTSGGAYTVVAHRPHDPNAVVVKVSTSTQHIYVMEGDRCLMAVQGCVGENGATHPGHYRVMEKIRNKRSGTFGFASNGAPADAHKGQHVAVGYPMGYWTAWAPGYGFHEGFVWSEPRTHGCIRLHKEAAARLFALTKMGTPVDIASSQPEDATLGKSVRRLDQRNDPDPPTPLLMSDSYFRDPPGQMFQD